ncbi:hypothetical protein [Ornithinimicrobium cerasi]|uniref:Tetratricopeptide repeat-containing protein n=1 Tax=Ornithinimicrobium cerasi TaxID=2248773 RepID=A0A285VMM2_9MICO|nr:hypothetical protein [Ornithinimicrobium cerasi]SOC55213.1 hypothetical protein SAMN05421879_104272 [Ornithinimicrobium cerasi]
MPGWDEVVAAVGLALGGDREEGLRALTACWEATEESDHAQRCVIAHYLADLQPTLDDEVGWDRTVLTEYAEVADADLAPVGITSAAAMAPSLHLNLGDGYLRQGRVADAETQLAEGLQVLDVLPADGYGTMVRGGLERLRSRVQEARNR